MTEPKSENLPTSPRWRYALLSVLSACLALGFLFWLNFPILDQLAKGNPYTLTPSIPPNTSTPRPTRTPTISPTPTLVPTITPTPFPPSAYEVQDLSQIDPPLKGLEGKGVILNDDKAIEANPPFNDPQWIPSSQIAQQLGKELPESYRATFGAASVTWRMDVPLAPGLYELYVLDTVYSSAGSLEFHVNLGGQEINPVMGSRLVNYFSSRGEDPQQDNSWRSIGIYQLDRIETLSVSTAWDKRDQDSIVAVDRVLIVPLSTSDFAVLGKLQRTQDTIIVDDLAAEIKSSQPIFPERSIPAWNGAFQYVVNPEKDIQVVWKPLEPLAPGQYELFLYVPDMHNTGAVGFHVYVNDKELTPDGSQGAMGLKEGDSQGGQWVSLGLYTTPRIFEKPVRFKVEMNIQAGSKSETAIDAIAFVKK